MELFPSRVTFPNSPISTWLTIFRVSLDLDENNLSGPISASIGNMSNLAELLTYENKLSGSIPTIIGQMANLSRLVLTENKLSGSIPTTIGDLTKLTYLSLMMNKLNAHRH
ncbi:putative leucine-rich repeat receptor-like protein kinase [Quercus suber]|uniref:Leucine-rich repeat receptor-like protein kinase n=1 Tax=Quercus suber TaxID=58331 RepID=A0AAW0LXK1_QUESU